jgi:arginase
VTQFAIIEAPSDLGLHPSGVANAPKALLMAGLAEGLRAEQLGKVPPPAYSAVRDPETQILNSDSLVDYANDLAVATGVALDRGAFPIVLGGDCSILLGNMLALRRRGRFGLFFLDGHQDFYQPTASPTGEAADMDLAIVTGNSHPRVTNLDGLCPLVREQDTILFANRDDDEVKEAGGQEIGITDIKHYNLDAVRDLGAPKAVREAVNSLDPGLAGIWIHLDVDVLSDEVMPAVDYRMPGGLSLKELEEVLQTVMEQGDCVGMDITIFNPNLDRDGKIAARLVACLVNALNPAGEATE